MYNVVVQSNPFSIQVYRASESCMSGSSVGCTTVIFDSSVGPVLYYNQLLQISTRRSSDFVYGFGETEHLTFKHDMGWTSEGMWARDNGVGPNSNLYGVQPYHLTMEKGTGHANGLLFLNANAMEVEKSPLPMITYRTIGGIIDFLVLTGPTPNEVTRQYTHYLGRSYLYPYWSLGFQICRYGYNSLDQMTKVVEENRAIGIPYDVQYGDIDYMERQLDFTIDIRSYNGLIDSVDKWRSEYNMR